MFSQSEYTLCKCDKNQSLIYVNDSLLELIGCDYGDIIGSDANSYRHPDVPQSLDRFVVSKMKQQGFFNGYMHCIDCHNHDFWLFIDTGKFHGMNGEFLGYETFGYIPTDSGIKYFEVLSHDLLTIEKKNPGSKGVDEAFNYLMQHIDSMDVSYDEFVCTTQGI